MITIGENSSDSKQMHKIGRGKPVGYGSVKITVDDISFRELDELSFSYSIKKQQYDDYMQKFDIKKHFDMKALSDFKTITKYSLTVCEDENGQKREIVPISYPIAEREPKDENESSENLKAGHQWFTGNRKTNNTFGRILPILTSDIDAMRLYALHGTNHVEIKQKNESARVEFQPNQVYDATIIGLHEYNGEDYLDFTVCGKKSNNKLRFFPEEIKRNPQKAINEHMIVKVKFVEKRGNRPVFYVINKRKYN